MTRADLIRLRVLQEPAGRLRHQLPECVKEATQFVDKLFELVPEATIPGFPHIDIQDPGNQHGEKATAREQVDPGALKIQLTRGKKRGQQGS